MEYTRQIGVHQQVPNLVAHLFQRSGAHDSGVGHQDVETSHADYRLFDGRTDRVGVAHVEGDRQAAPAKLLNSLGGVAKVILGAEGLGVDVRRTGGVSGDDVAAV